MKKLSIKDIVEEDDREEIKVIFENLEIEFESDYEEENLRDLEVNKRNKLIEEFSTLQI